MSGKSNKPAAGRGASTRSDAAAAEQYVSRLSLGEEALPPSPSLLPLAIRHSSLCITVTVALLSPCLWLDSDIHGPERRLPLRRPRPGQRLPRS